MKKFIQTLKNIWSIEELKSKIIFTLLIVAIYRLGTHIVLPGMDPELIDPNAGAQGGILGLIDAFAGGAFSQASILALGIMPYISASIFMQLATILYPPFQKMQKEGESGRKKINQYTRYLTVIVAVLQASAYVAYLNNPGYQEAILPEYQSFFAFSTTIILTGGTLFVMWLGEKITDKGLGNGASLIIMIGIIARLPQSIVQEWEARVSTGGGGGILIFVLEIALFVFITMGTIALIQGVRKIPVQYAKQIVGNRQFGGARQFLPMKVNSSGVMPIIFAQAIMFLPTLLGNFETTAGFASIFSDPSNGWYMLIYAFMVIAFTFLYTALVYNPKQIAEDLKRNNGFIPGVKPGQATADYIGAIFDRITLPGAFLLAFIGILPGFIQMLGVQMSFASFFGGTSLLIMVGVVLDTLQQIETQLLMRQYDGLMKSGKIQGRQGISSTTAI